MLGSLRPSSHAKTLKTEEFPPLPLEIGKYTSKLKTNTNQAEVAERVKKFLLVFNRP